MLASTVLTALSALALAPLALASIYVTSPTASIPCTAGTPCPINWADSGEAPLLKTLGLCSVGLWVGSVNQQVELQSFSTNLNVSQTGSLSVTIDPKVGAVSNQYFIRFVSNSYVDPASAYNAKFSAFSAKFQLNGMTGTFNSTVKALIDAGSQTTVGLGASQTAAVVAPATTSSSAARVSASSGASALAVGAAAASSAASKPSTISTTSSASPRAAAGVLTLPVALGSLALLAAVLL